MQPGYLDVEGEASNQPGRLIIGPDLPLRHLSQLNHRWALLGTATALVLMVVVVLGFGDATVQRSSASSLTTAFTPVFLAPTVQMRPLTRHRQQLVTTSSSNTLHGRPRSSLQMQTGEEAPDNYRDRKAWATQEKKNSQEEWPHARHPDKRERKQNLHYSRRKESEAREGAEAVDPAEQEDGAPGAEPEAEPREWPTDEDEFVRLATDGGLAKVEAEREAEDVATAEAVTMFAMMDLDGDGVVTEKEFATYLAAFSYTQSASSRIFKALDANGDGEISVSEVCEMVNFVHGASNASPSALDGSGVSKAEVSELVRRRRDEADRMFDIIDQNGDGEISGTELKTYLVGVGYSKIAAESVLRSLDTNDDGIISRFELFDGFEKYSALRTKCLSASRDWH